MSHIYRFYGQLELGDAGRIVLRDEEAHHAIHVLRVKEGQEVHVFDGLGTCWVCRVEEVSRKDVVCSVVDTEEQVPESPRVIVSMAWLNKDKAVEELIQRCTELGVAEFRFFRGEHSGREPEENRKWLKWAVESCKQCGRVWLPRFDVYDGLAGIIRRDETTLVASLGSGCVPLNDAVDGSQDVNILIGPEGDFSDTEYSALAAQGVKAVSLGDAVYRSQVAASVLSTLVMYELGRMGAWPHRTGGE